VEQGDNCTASGGDALAEGAMTLASGSSSHAEGDLTTASGEESHSEGVYTVASGQVSHAEGQGTTAGGYASFAGGVSCDATNDFSFVWNDDLYNEYGSKTNNTFNVHANNGFHFDGGPAYFNGVSLSGNPSNSISSQFENLFSKLYVSGGTGLYANYNGIYNNSRAGTFTNETTGWVLLQPGLYDFGGSTNILRYTFVTNAALFTLPAINYPGADSPFLISTNYQCWDVSQSLSVAICNPGSTDTAFGFPTNTLGTHGLTLAFTNRLFMGATPY
jgi:hypothetical protein